MMNLFFAILLIGFIFLSYRKLLWGVGAVIVLLPAYLWRFDILGLPTTFLELLIVSLFIIWLIKEKKYTKINFSLQKNSNNQVPKILRYLLGLWSLAAILALLTNFSYSSLGLWRAYFLEPLMFFLVFIYTVKDKKDWKVIINSLGLLLAWLFTVAMYQNFTNWNYINAYNFPNVKRLTGPFAYPNALSLITAPLTALFAGLWIYTKDKLLNWHYLILFIFGVSLAIMTVSQGAISAIGFALFLALILAKKIRKIGISIIVLGLISILLVLPSIDINPELNLQSSSLDIRLNQWQETSDLLADNFLLGVGLNGYQAALQNYHQTEWLEIYLYPHNIFLNFWTEMGIFGLLVFVSLLVYVVLLLKNLFKNKNNLAWPLAMMWVTWFIHGLVDVPYFKNDLSILFFTMLVFTLVVSKYKKDVKS
ncbi:MAG: O-antigen ligase family protein [Candidatus Komeilibacteria bacterium]|nr:O-antigen ligase family protein [Candidatus Komeilibacteria bacterium]MBT4447453.1 O-antigen ligase family protein [Candidatus Komeilibacteria bacterium]